MTTRKLLWGMTWRGGLTTSACSTALVACVALCGIAWLVKISLEQVHSQSSPNLYEYAMLNIIVGIVLAVWLTWLIGIVIGFIFGAPGGFILGILTRMFFFPFRDTRKYFKTMIIFSVMWGLLCGLGFSWWLFESSALTVNLYQLCGLFGSANIPILKFFFLLVVPILLAIIIAIIVGHSLTKWYERESAKGLAQNVSPN